MIGAAFEDLSQALRVLLEANWRAHSQNLLLVDRAEAVGNIDTAVSGVLNALHSVYDAMGKDARIAKIDWYREPELAAILAIRNARHHNRANKIRHLYNYHIQTSATPQERKQYVLVDFPASDDGDTFEVHLSWADLDAFLSLPAKESRLRPESAKKIRAYLNADAFAGYAATHGIPVSHVFINIVPLIVNAAAKVVPLINAHIKATSTEAETFKMLFADMQAAKTREHEVQVLTLFFPK